MITCLIKKMINVHVSNKKPLEFDIQIAMNYLVPLWAD